MAIPSERDCTNDETWNCWLRTFLAGSTSVLIFMYVGMNEGTSTLLLSQLRKESSVIRISHDQETWVASLGMVSAPIGAILCGPFIDALGRKRGVSSFFFIMGFGFAVIGCAREVTHIFAGRIICSFGEGFLACAIVYIAEICTPKQRLLILSMDPIMYSGGVFICSVVGAYVPWTGACLTFSLVAFALAVAEWFVPESPAWLFSQGNEGAAVRSLHALGRSKPNIVMEIDTLRQCKSISEKLTLGTFTEPTVWKPFVILNTFHLLQYMTGFYQIIYYQIDFLQSLGTTLNYATFSISSSAIRFFSSCIVVLYFRKLPRKLATTISGFSMGIPMLGAGIYECMFRDTAAENRPFQWLLLSFIFTYIMAGNLAVAYLPWTMSGELFPLKVRGIMSGVTMLVAYSIFFVFVKTYYALFDVLQIYGLLFAFAASSIASGLFGIYILPETQGKSLMEVEESFKPKKKKSNKNVEFVTRF